MHHAKLFFCCCMHSWENNVHSAAFGPTLSSFGVWKTQRACTAELVLQANPPSSESLSLPSLLLSPLTPILPLCTIFYMFLVLCPLPFYQFLHLPSSTSPAPPSSASAAHFPLFMIFHTHVSPFSSTPQEHRRCVIYTCEGKHTDTGEQRAIPGIHNFLFPE